MQIEISVTMSDIAEAVRDLYKKRGGNIPESMSVDLMQWPNGSKHKIEWPRDEDGKIGWHMPFLEIICSEPMKK